MGRCRQCGRVMNPVEVMMSDVCGECCRENHAKACGRYAAKEQKLADRRQVRKFIAKMKEA